jgi:hypothetical protein
MIPLFEHDIFEAADFGLQPTDPLLNAELHCSQCRYLLLSLSLRLSDRERHNAAIHSVCPHDS